MIIQKAIKLKKKQIKKVQVLEEISDDESEEEDEPAPIQPAKKTTAPRPQIKPQVQPKQTQPQPAQKYRFL